MKKTFPPSVIAIPPQAGEAIPSKQLISGDCHATLRVARNDNKCFLPTIFAVAAISLAIAFHAGRVHGASNIADAKLLDRALTAVERNYVDPVRIDIPKMFMGALTRMQEEIPEILVKSPENGTFKVTVGLAIRQFKYDPMVSISDLKRAMREVLSFIAANYRGETKPEEIEYAAIDGMLGALDPHSNFMPPKIYNEFKVGTRGEFGGLGIVISIKDGKLTVVAPIDGTPASRAGIRAGDRILQIDDESTINMSLTDAVNRLRGEIDAKVSIVVERKGQAPKKIALKRALINIDSVQQMILPADGKRIGYLKVKSFQSNTEDDVVKALKSMTENGQKLDGLILDLRNNPGGLLNIAVDIADNFLNGGVIVSTVGPHDQVFEKEVARTSTLKENSPMIVLMNEGSASASEIVAGALKANNRALIMGRQSFGKGSVQTIFELGDDTAMKLTIAQYKPAGTEVIQLFGVTPDIELMPATVDKKDMNLIEDVLPSEVDLEEHLESDKPFKVEGTAPAIYKIRYLKPAENEKKIEELSAREYAKKPDIKDDFAVELALRLLTSAGKDKREEFLASVKAPLALAEGEEDVKINGALKLLGIDWSTPKTKGEPKLKIAYKMNLQGKEITKALAGQKIGLTLTATNVGDGTYSRLIAVGQSDMMLLSNREFVFGLLPPGSSRSSNIEIELPEALATQDLIMNLSFEDAGRVAPASVDVRIPVEELPKPQFTFSYSLPTAPKNFKTGVSVPVTFNITNTGGGTTSAETQAALSNECGDKLFIENGRAKLGVMASKAARKAAFKFHLTQNVTGSDPATTISAGGCKLKLTIADVKKVVAISKKFDVVEDRGVLTPAANVKYSPPVVTTDKDFQSTPDTEIKITGKITDTDNIRDYYIFVGDKKFIYVPNPSDTSNLDFSATLPLEPGINYIWIGARDEMDLNSSKTVVVERTSGEKKKGPKFKRGGMRTPNVQP